MNELKKALEKFLNEDQIKAMKNKKRNNQPWGSKTIGDCYKMLAKLGNSKYSFLRSIEWPIVSLRTLQERTSQVRFLPGPQNQFMDILGEKVSKDSLGQLAVMGVDEMETRYEQVRIFKTKYFNWVTFNRRRIDIDRSSKTLVGIENPFLAKEKPPGEETAWPAANHIQSTVVRGLCWHYKQLVAFDFTGNDFAFLQFHKY